MDPSSAAQKYEAWQQHFGQGAPTGQTGQAAPPQGSAPGSGYNAYFEGGNPQAGGDYSQNQSGQWAPPPSYNSVAPPRAERGSYRGYNNGGSSGGSYNRESSGSYNRESSGSYNRESSGGGYNRGGGSSYNEPIGGPPAPVNDANKMIFVSGLPQHANETFIHDVFASEGVIEINEMNGKPKIKIYQDHGVSKGECTISFIDANTALKVVSTMNGQPFPGTDNVMQISMAQFSNAPKPDAGRGGGSRGFDRGSGRNFRGDRGGRGNFDGDRGGRANFGGDRDGGSFRGDRGGRANFGGDRDGGSFRGGRGGRGNFNRGDRDSNGGGYRGDRGGGRDDRQGGGFQRGGGRGRDDSGFGNRGARGAGGNAEVREGDWMCPCGNNNFSFRRECNSCKTPRGADGGSSGGSSGGGGQMRGGRQNDGGNRHRPY